MAPRDPRADRESAANLPPLPPLEKRSDWPEFKKKCWYYLFNPWFGPGGDETDFRKMLVDRPDNAEQSRRLDEKLVGVLSGEANAAFDGEVNENKYRFKGFTKIRILHDLFNSASDQLLAADMIEFLGGFDQGRKTVHQFEQELVSRISDFEAFSGSEEENCSFPRILKFGLMVRGLNEDLRNTVIAALQEGRLDVHKATTSDLSTFLRNVTDEGWIKFHGHRRRAGPSASQVSAEGGGAGGGGGGGGSGGGTGNGGGEQKPSGKDKDGKVYTNPFPWLASLSKKAVVKGIKIKGYCGCCHKPVPDVCPTGIVGCEYLKAAGYEAKKLPRKKDAKKSADPAASAAKAGEEKSDDAPAASAVSLDQSEGTSDGFQWEGAEPWSAGDVGCVPASGFTGGPGASATDFPPLPRE